MSLIGPEGSKQLKLAARFASAGFELAASVVVGYFAGRWLDQKLDMAPVLQLLGLVLGIVAGFRSLYRLARDAQSQAQTPSKSNDTKDPNDDPNRRH